MTLAISNPHAVVKAHGSGCSYRGCAATSGLDMTIMSFNPPDGKLKVNAPFCHRAKMMLAKLRPRVALRALLKTWLHREVDCWQISASGVRSYRFVQNHSIHCRIGQSYGLIVTSGRCGQYNAKELMGESAGVKLLNCLLDDQCRVRSAGQLVMTTTSLEAKRYPFRTLFCSPRSTVLSL